MDDDNAERTVWWRCREWKCESWVAADGRQWLELYQGVRVALARPVRDAEQLQALADSWRDALAETYSEETVMPEPHAGGSDHGATPNVVDAGTTMDDAVPRHRWRQAFGCEGEK